MGAKWRKALVIALTSVLAVNMTVSSASAGENETNVMTGENGTSVAAGENETGVMAGENGSGVTAGENEPGVMTGGKMSGIGPEDGTSENDLDQMMPQPRPEGEGAVGETAKKEITGFGEDENRQISLESKLSLEDIDFPENLKVFTVGSEEPEDIPVTWVCEDDYENTDYEIYTFSPQWDGEKYFFAGSSFAVPCLEIRIGSMGNPNVREGDEVTPGPEDYTVSGGAITGLSSAFLNGLTAVQKQNIHLVIPGTVGGQSVTSIAKDAFSLWYSSKYADCQFVSLDMSAADQLTGIGDNAFYAASGLTGSLTIPSGVTAIGNNAFRGCKGFTGTLQLPQELKTIGTYAFNDIGCVGTLRIPGKVTSIGESAFRVSDSELSGFSGELVIPASVSALGKVAFSGNKNITSVVFEGNNLTQIPDSVFRYCGLSGAVTIPAGVQQIGGNVFDSTNLKTIYLPKRTDPGNSAFIASNTFGTYSSSKLLAIVCDKEDYAYIGGVLGTNFAKRVGYPCSVSFENGGSIEPISRLYNLPYNYVKDEQGVWSADGSYRFPLLEGKKWGLTPDAISPVSESVAIKQDKLYAIPALEDPVITYGEGIDKVYDGNPQTLKVEASHPLAKPSSQANLGDVVFHYTWAWGTITSSPAVLSGYDENQYNVTDVRESRFAISCRVRVRACVLREGDEGTVATVFYTEEHDFPVFLRKAQPEVNPVYPKGMLNIADGMPEISLSAGDSPGTISWDDGQSLTDGKQEYHWTYKPEKNAAGNYNHEEKTGTAELCGVDGKVFHLTVHAAEHGQISPADGLEIAQGSRIDLQFQPDAGYRLESVTVNGQDVTGAVTDGAYTLDNVQSDPEITAVFSPLSAEDMGTIIDRLPEIPQGDKPTKEQENSILEAKQHLDALPETEKNAVSEAEKEKLREAVVSLPQVETAVNGEIRLKDDTLLLDNMTGQDAQKLAEDNSSFKIEVVAQNTQPNQKEREAIESVLGDGVVCKNLDIQVIKTVTVNNNPTVENLSVLSSPIRLVFSIPEEDRKPQPGYSREFFIVRAHETEGNVTADTLKDLDDSEDTVTVDSDKYSVYAIAFKDTKTKDEEKPRNYNIRAESQGGGRISPSGGIRVEEGADQSFSFTPDSGFVISQVLIDGRDVGAVTGYTFRDVKGDHTVKVIFEAEQTAAEKTYEVAFDSQGGSGVPSIKNVKYGSRIQAPESPERAGYSFTGWFTEKECKNQWNFEQDIITGSRILYAGWKQNSGTSENTESPKASGAVKTGDAADNAGVGWMAVSALLMLASLAALKKKRL